MAISTFRDSSRAEPPLDITRPPGFRGAAFGAAQHGDVRIDPAARTSISAAVGCPDVWAHASQVHGSRVVQVTDAGPQGEADALFVTTPGISLVVATADCVPVVLEARHAVAVVHAGWRGAVAGVLEETLAAMRWAGHAPERAAIGPSIRPCCYEVGTEVAERFTGHTGTTTWGTTSVDIAGFLAQRLEALDVWRSPVCTYEDEAYNSHRRDATRSRQIAVGWLPQG